VIYGLGYVLSGVFTLEHQLAAHLIVASATILRTR